MFGIYAGRTMGRLTVFSTRKNTSRHVYSQTIEKHIQANRRLFTSELLCPLRPCEEIVLSGTKRALGKVLMRARIRDQGICAHPAASKPALLCNPPAHRTNPLHQAEFRPNRGGNSSFYHSIPHQLDHLPHLQLICA